MGRWCSRITYNTLRLSQQARHRSLRGGTPGKFPPADVSKEPNALVLQLKPTRCQALGEGKLKRAATGVQVFDSCSSSLLSRLVSGDGSHYDRLNAYVHSRQEALNQIMFVNLLATPEDIPQIASLQFRACADDPGFNAIFPKNQTDVSLPHLIKQFEQTMTDDLTATIAVAKEPLQGEIVSYAVWHLFPQKDAESVEEEMLADIGSDALLPDANIELGRLLIKNSVQKRIEVASRYFGMGEPYAYLAAFGTNPKYQRQGAAAKLIEWAVRCADEQNLPAYVESTPVAVSFYQKFGFKEHDRLELILPSDTKATHYNTCMIRFPGQV